jgi:thiosulfate/3-mercaptopyruvate sulfurtransferase
MDFQTILSAEDLHSNINHPDWVIVDCRFYLEDLDRGHQEYLESHIPGAIYVHLDDDLSGEIIPGKTGRHPLPDSQVIADRLSNWGIDNSTQVVVYDNNNGAIAARLWWLLRWLGHKSAAVLDGGWDAWVGQDYPGESGEISNQRKIFQAVEQPDHIADADLVDQIRNDNNFILLDARPPARFWGLEEPIDERAGHIPGAVTAPYELNLTPEGYFKSAAELRERFESLLEGVPPSQVIVYCGSGVTANHNLLAMAEAGLDMALMYPGSWSEWITDSNRPIGP